MHWHGHVVARPDGFKARCGGPGLCSVCQAEKAALYQTDQEWASRLMRDAMLLDEVRRLGT
jgi:hypothetical protein